MTSSLMRHAMPGHLHPAYRDVLLAAPDEIVWSELEQETAEFRPADGTYTFPMACRLYWGSK